MGRASPYAHLWPLVEAMYLERISAERIAYETGLNARTVLNHVNRTGLHEVREMAMADRIAELRAEHERRAA